MVRDDWSNRWIHKWNADRSDFLNSPNLQSSTSQNSTSQNTEFQNTAHSQSFCSSPPSHQFQQPYPTLALLEIPAGYLNILGYVNASEVSGPGRRAVIWVQGSFRKCPGCFHPSVWSFAIQRLVTIESLLEKILAEPRNQGITFAGGEPFWQAPALTNLAQKAKAARLSVMAFTGFYLEQLRSPYAPAGAEDLLSQLDILVDGPFPNSSANHSPDCSRFSKQRRIHLFNSALVDRLEWECDRTEIHRLEDDSQVVVNGHGQFHLVNPED